MALRAARVIGKGAGWLGIISVIVALASALTWNFSTADLTDRASQLDQVDLTLGSAAVTRAATTQAVLVAVNNSNGAATDEALTAALTEAAVNVEALDQLANQLTAAGEVEILGSSATSVIELIRSGAIEEARAAAESTFQEAYSAAVAALTARRSGLVGDLESAATFAGRLGPALRVGVVLAIPLLVMLIMSSSNRRRRRSERTDFLAAVDDAAAGAVESDQMLLEASHRFRTPLTSIYGLAEVLVQSKNVSRLERELISLVHSESADLYRIADDVLVATQQRTGSLEATAEILALAEIVEESVKPIRATGVEIKVDCPEVWVLSDPAKVRQIIRNIVANAAKHGAEPIFVEVSEVDGRVECDIVDHGDGLPQTFDPASGVFPEEGLGLRIAFLLSDLIDARLHYRRVDDQSRFTLSFTEDGPATDSRPQFAIPQPMEPAKDEAE